MRNSNLTAFNWDLLYANLGTHLNRPQLTQFQEMIISTLKEVFHYNVQSITCFNTRTIIFAFECNSGTADQLMKYISYALCDYEEFLERHNRSGELDADELCEHVKSPFVDAMVNEGHFKAVAFDEVEGLQEHPRVSSVPTLNEIIQALQKSKAMANSELTTDEINTIWFTKFDTASQLDTVKNILEDYMVKHVDYED